MIIETNNQINHQRTLYSTLTTILMKLGTQIRDKIVKNHHLKTPKRNGLVGNAKWNAINQADRNTANKHGITQMAKDIQNATIHMEN